MSSTMRHLAGGVLVAAVFTALSAATPACDPDNGGITLPAGFCAFVAADGLGTARHLVVAANGDVYVALQGTGEQGGVVALRDTNGDARFEQKSHFRRYQHHGHRAAQRIPLCVEPQYRGAVQDDARPVDAVWRGRDRRDRAAGRAPARRQRHRLRRQGISLRQCRRAFERLPVARPLYRSAGQDPCPILEKNGGIWKFDENKVGQKQEDGTRFATGLRQMPGRSSGTTTRCTS